MKTVRVALALLFFGALWVWYLPPQTEGLEATEYACGAPETPCTIGERSYHILVPKGEGPFPAVVFFHGSGQSGADVLGYNTVGQPLLERGYAIIAPDALDVTYADGKNSSGWIWEGRRGAKNDHQFARDVIADATARFLIEQDELIIAGHSNGATFVWYMACAGALPNQRDFATTGGTLVRGRLEKCAEVRRGFNLIHTHGARDQVVPADGSTSSGSWTGWLGAHESVDALAAASGCTRQETVAETTTRWSRCRTTGDYRLVLGDGGHEIPQDWVATVTDWYTGVKAQR